MFFFKKKKLAKCTQHDRENKTVHPHMCTQHDELTSQFIYMCTQHDDKENKRLFMHVHTTWQREWDCPSIYDDKVATKRSVFWFTAYSGSLGIRCHHSHQDGEQTYNRKSYISHHNSIQINLLFEKPLPSKSVQGKYSRTGSNLMSCVPTIPASEYIRRILKTRGKPSGMESWITWVTSRPWHCRPLHKGQGKYCRADFQNRSPTVWSLPWK